MSKARNKRQQQVEYYNFETNKGAFQLYLQMNILKVLESQCLV